VLRATVARRVPIRRACRLLGVERDPLLEALNLARQRQAARRIPLTLVSQGPA
jgi:hypothetical protein